MEQPTPGRSFMGHPMCIGIKSMVFSRVLGAPQIFQPTRYQFPPRRQTNVHQCHHLLRTQRCGIQLHNQQSRLHLRAFGMPHLQHQRTPSLITSLFGTSDLGLFGSKLELDSCERFGVFPQLRGYDPQPTAWIKGRGRSQFPFMGVG